MGRKTYESLGKPLKGRLNVVISRKVNSTKLMTTEQNVIVFKSLYEAYNYLDAYDKCFIIGGAEIYKESIKNVDYIYQTVILKNYKGDAFFPKINRHYKIVSIKLDKNQDFNSFFIKYEHKDLNYVEYIINRLYFILKIKILNNYG